MENIQKNYEKEIFELKSQNQTLKIGLEEKSAEIERLNTNYPVNGVSKPVCDKNHLLQFYTDDSRNYQNFTCKKCRTISRHPSFHCPPCKYDLCDKCYAFPFSRDKCMYKHSLVKGNSWDRQNSTCDRCFREQARFWYYCNACDFDLCKSCHDLL